MSFSFIVTGKDKTEAYDKATTEMDAVVQAQPAHSKDGWLVKQTVRAYLDLLPNDPTQHIAVSAHGSVGWQYDAADPTGSNAVLNQASIGVSAWFVPAKSHAQDTLDITE
jgi:hypothetical protein